jgi:hypothetical protein
MNTFPHDENTILVMAAASTILETCDTDESSVLVTMNFIHQLLSRIENKEVLHDFKYWEEAFAKVRLATTREDLKIVLVQYVCKQHAMTYPIAGSAMMATVNLIEKKLFYFTTGEFPTFRTRKQAMHCTRTLLSEIAAETLETVDQMVDRLEKESKLKYPR